MTLCTWRDSCNIVCINRNILIFQYIYIYVYVYMCACVCVCVCVCLCVCVCACVFVAVQTKRLPCPPFSPSRPASTTCQEPGLPGASPSACATAFAAARLCHMGLSFLGGTVFFLVLKGSQKETNHFGGSTKKDTPICVHRAPSRTQHAFYTGRSMFGAC